MPKRRKVGESRREFAERVVLSKEGTTALARKKMDRDLKRREDWRSRLLNDH